MAQEKMEKAEGVLREGVEAGRKVSADLTHAIKSNPWPYIAGAAAFTFFLGMFLKSSRKE